MKNDLVANRKKKMVRKIKKDSEKCVQIFIFTQHESFSSQNRSEQNLSRKKIHLKQL